MLESGPFGTSYDTVTRVGLGGEGVLRTHGQERAAQAVILSALKAGIIYFDSARVYADSERYLGSIWETQPDQRQALFQTSKSAQRDRSGALQDLDQTLQRLRTDHLDLWQIHDVRTVADIQRIEAPGGALEAFVDARQAGKVRHIGVTGHHDPAVLTHAVQNWPVEAVLLPVNPVEAIIGGFLTETLPAAQKRGLATIGMKILGGSHYVLVRFNVTAEALIRFARSYDIDVAIVGCSTPDEVRQLAAAGTPGPKMQDSEKRNLLDIFRPYAHDLAFYRGVK